MHWLSYMYGHVPGVCDIGWGRQQMCNRPGKMYIMRHLCQCLPGVRNCTGTGRNKTGGTKTNGYKTGRTETGIKIIKNRATPGFFVRIIVPISDHTWRILTSYVSH